MKNLTLSDDVVHLVEALAQAEGRPVEEVVADALRERLVRSSAIPNGTFRLPTFRGTGVKPGVNLDSNAALLDLMDDMDARR